MMMILFGGENN